MNGHQSSGLDTFETLLFRRLAESQLYLRFCEAFRHVTGLPLRLAHRDEPWCLIEHSENQSAFCEQLQDNQGVLPPCADINNRLAANAEESGPKTAYCFAGLCTTAVPVNLGSKVIGFLKTGQVFHQHASPERFKRIIKVLRASGLKESAIENLRRPYLETRAIDSGRYDSMVTLLEPFAHQQSAHAEGLSTPIDGREPEIILKVRTYIHNHLDQPVSLDFLSRYATVSPSHLCSPLQEGHRHNYHRLRDSGSYCLGS